MYKKSLLMLSCASLLSASTTMCFKKDHMDPSTIDSTALDGGKCKGSFSANDMTKKGYEVDDIKITSGKNGLDYIYIFKKGSTVTASNNNGMPMSKAQMKAYLKEINQEEKAQKEKEEKEGSIKLGEKIYKSSCIKCHGNGTIRAYNTARPLIELNEEEIKSAIRAYNLSEKDNGMAILMKPIADSLIDREIKSVATYIQTLKK